MPVTDRCGADRPRPGTSFRADRRSHCCSDAGANEERWRPFRNQHGFTSNGCEVSFPCLRHSLTAIEEPFYPASVEGLQQAIAGFIFKGRLVELNGSKIAIWAT